MVNAKAGTSQEAPASKSGSSSQCEKEKGEREFMKKILILSMFLGSFSSFALGYDLPFTNDGKFYEEKLLNREISTEDTTLKIEKMSDQKYKVVYYNDFETGEKTDKPTFSVDAVKNKNMICDDTDVCIAYDTKLKRAVFVDKDTNKIIFPEVLDSDNGKTDEILEKLYPNDFGKAKDNDIESGVER